MALVILVSIPLLRTLARWGRRKDLGLLAMCPFMSGGKDIKHACIWNACVYTSIYIYIDMYIRTHMHIHTCRHMYAYIDMYMNLCTCTWTLSGVHAGTLFFTTLLARSPRQSHRRPLLCGSSRSIGSKRGTLNTNSHPWIWYECMYVYILHIHTYVDVYICVDICICI